MKPISSTHPGRLLATLLLGGILSAVVGCASTSTSTSASASASGEQAASPAQSIASTKAQASARRVDQADPFEVARGWATELPGAKRAAEMLSPQVHSITASWTAAQVARVWAAGDEYRALIIEKSTTGQRPAVLLYLGRDSSDAWKIEAIKPSTSTALWSQF